MSIPNSPIWVVQDNLHLSEKAIDVFDKFQSELCQFEASKNFSSEALTASVRLRLRTAKYFEELLNDYSITLFIGEISSLYYSGFKRFSLETKKNWDVSTCTRKVICLGLSSLAKMTVRYRKRVRIHHGLTFNDDIPF
jgi:hypothetical protein